MIKSSMRNRIEGKMIPMVEIIKTRNRRTVGIRKVICNKPFKSFNISRCLERINKSNEKQATFELDSFGIHIYKGSQKYLTNLKKS